MISHKAICREFNVNYEWLKNGEGEMFDALPETLVDELADEFNLDIGAQIKRRTNIEWKMKSSTK